MSKKDIENNIVELKLQLKIVTDKNFFYIIDDRDYKTNLCDININSYKELLNTMSEFMYTNFIDMYKNIEFVPITNDLGIIERYINKKYIKEIIINVEYNGVSINTKNFELYRNSLLSICKVIKEGIRL